MASSLYVLRIQTLVSQKDLLADMLDHLLSLFPQYWGLFNSDRTLKDITFPTCAVDSGSASG